MILRNLTEAQHLESEFSRVGPAVRCESAISEVNFDWDFEEEGFKFVSDQVDRSPKFQQTFRFELVEMDFGLGLRRGRI